MRRLRLVAAALATGVAAGVGGALLTLALHAVQHTLFGYSAGSFLTGLEQAQAWRRVGGAVVGGAVAGAGWWWLRRRGPVTSMSDALSKRRTRMPLRRTAVDALLQITAVGGGASVGREGAPRQVGAAAGARVAERLHVPAQRRLLIAAGAGAGLAAVYNVPLSGVIFAVLALGESLPVFDVLLIALACGSATLVAWPVVGAGTVYAMPRSSLTVAAVVGLACWSLIAGPVSAAAGWTLDRLARRAMARETRPAPSLLVSAGTAAGVVGVASIWWPWVAGNGKGIVELALASGASQRTVGTFTVLFVLKIVLTVVCLRAGIVGGLLTPALGIGAALGAAAALAMTALGVPSDPALWALVGASAVLAVSHRSAVFAVVLMWELTHAPWLVVVGAALAGTGARWWLGRARSMRARARDRVGA